ncbi:MAG: hypothetical protein U1E65_22770 [Myxococcota bacterium]
MTERSQNMLRIYREDLVEGRLVRLVPKEHASEVQRAIDLSCSGQLVDAAKIFLQLHGQTGVSRLVIAAHAVGEYAAMGQDYWTAAAIFGLLHRSTGNPYFEDLRAELMRAQMQS